MFMSIMVKVEDNVTLHMDPFITRHYKRHRRIQHSLISLHVKFHVCSMYGSGDMS